MKKVIKIMIKNFGGNAQIGHNFVGQLEDWIKVNGVLRDALSRALANAMQATEAGGIVFITQEWEV